MRSASPGCRRTPNRCAGVPVLHALCLLLGTESVSLNVLMGWQEAVLTAMCAAADETMTPGAHQTSVVDSYQTQLQLVKTPNAGSPAGTFTWNDISDDAALECLDLPPDVVAVIDNLLRTDEGNQTSNQNQMDVNPLKRKAVAEQPQPISRPKRLPKPREIFDPSDYH